jgi:hypothetical protein
MTVFTKYFNWHATQLKGLDLIDLIGRVNLKDAKYRHSLNFSEPIPLKED